MVVPMIKSNWELMKETGVTARMRFLHTGSTQYMYGTNTSFRIYQQGNNVLSKGAAPSTYWYTYEDLYQYPAFQKSNAYGNAYQSWYVSGNINASVNTNGYSFGGLFRINVLGTNQGIIGNWTPTNQAVLLKQADPQTLSMHHNAVTTTWTHNFQPGEWHYFMVTMTPADSRQRLYVDGRLVRTSEPVPSIVPVAATQFTVGGHDTTGAYPSPTFPDMDMTFFGMWENKALSAREILALARNVALEKTIWFEQGSNSPMMIA